MLKVRQTVYTDSTARSWFTRSPTDRRSRANFLSGYLSVDIALRPMPQLLLSVFSCALQQGAYNTLMDAGITFFDTSDVYGYKSTKRGFSAEQLLGRFAEENVRNSSSCKA